MRTTAWAKRTLVLGGLIAVSPLLLAACGKKEPEPTAPGYYTGPMKAKGADPKTLMKSGQGVRESD